MLPKNFKPGTPASFAEYASKRSQIVAACKVEEVVIEDVEPVEPEIAKPGENLQKIKAWLATQPHGATIAEIISATGIAEGSVRGSIYWSHSFEEVDEILVGKRLRKVWKVKEGVGV